MLLLNYMISIYKLRVIVLTSSNASTFTQVLIPKCDNNNNNNIY